MLTVDVEEKRDGRQCQTEKSKHPSMSALLRSFDANVNVDLRAGPLGPEVVVHGRIGEDDQARDAVSGQSAACQLSGVSGIRFGYTASGGWTHG